MPHYLTTLLYSLPLLALIVVMVKPRPVPAVLALPLAALALYLIKLAMVPTDPRLLHAAVISGLLAALAPLLVVWGAILLFRCMEQTGATDVICQWLGRLSPHPVSQLVIVGWSFSFLIEGISGFGTPAALAAPLLVATGFPALRVAMLCLVMNTVPVSFGAVGMPLWFGLGELDLNPAMLEDIGRRTALLHACAAPVIPLLALRMVLPWSVIRSALPFVLLSITATMVPYVLAAWWNNEFPSIAGGSIGLVVTILLARKGIGLRATGPAPQATSATSAHPIDRRRLLLALFPIGATVLLLLVTRIDALGLRAWLQALEPAWRTDPGGLGEIGISRSLVLQWQGILGSDLNWTHALLYVPSLLPFLLVTLISLRLNGSRRPEVRTVFVESWQRIRRPLGAFLGALVFARLMMTGPGESPVQLMANAMAGVAGPAWQGVAVLLGALGSFFSGSATVSNLTFGAIQLELAELRGLDPATILALQSVGAALGNMVCIHNIVAVCSILGLQQAEGTILRRNTPSLLIYAMIVALASFLLFPG